MLTFLAKHVTLTAHELMLAGVAGVMRQIENMREQREPAYAASTAEQYVCPSCGSKFKGVFQMHIEGCVGEKVISKHLDKYWVGKGTFRGPDVGANDRQKIRVRCSAGTDLIVHDDDPSDAMFYLVRWRPGSFNFEVSEGILGRDAKQKHYWREKGERGCLFPAYFVPVSYNKQLKLT